MWFKTVLLFIFTIFVNTIRPVSAQVVDSSSKTFWDLVKLNNSGQYSKAMGEAKKLLTHAPDFPGSYEQLAFAFIKAGETHSGIAWFDSLRLTNPNNPYVYFALARFEKSRDKTESAIENLKQCLELNPEFADAYLNLVEISRTAGELANTEKFIVSQIQVDSLNAAAFYGLGCIYHFRNEYARAAGAFNKCLKLNPELIHAYYLMGLMYEKQKNYNKAIEIWELARGVAERKNELISLALITGRLSNACYEVGKWQKAVSLGKEALQLAQLFGDRKLEGEHLNNLSEPYMKLGQSDKAFECCEQALAIAKEIGDDLLLEKTLGNLAQVYNAKGQYNTAIDHAGKALKMAEARGDSDAIGAYCWRIGVGHAQQANYQEALQYYKHAVTAKRKVNDKYTVGHILGNTGTVYKQMGDITKAIELYSQSLQIAREISHEYLQMLAMGWLGYAHNGLGEYTKAITFIEPALALAEKTGFELGKAVYRGNLGLAYKKMGYFDKSLDVLQQALKIHQKTGNRRGQIYQYINIASIYEIRGSYLQSLEYEKKALEISRDIGSKHTTATVLGNIGVIYDKIGRWDDALEYLNQALNVNQEINAKYGEASDLANMGSVYFHKGDFDQAKESFLKSLTVARNVGDQERESQALENMGVLSERSKEYNKALNYYNQALDIAKNFGEKIDEGWLYVKIGNVYNQIGDFPVALRFYQQALAVSEELDAFELMFESFAGLAIIKSKQNFYDDALTYYNQAIDLLESVRERLHIESYKTTFVERKIPVYEGIISLMLREGKFEDAYNYLQRFRARSFLEILTPDRIDITAGISPQLFDQYRAVEQNLLEIYQRIGHEYRKGEENSNQELIASLENRLEKARQEHQFVSDEIRLNHPRYAELTGMSNPFTLPEIKKTLSQLKVNIVEYFVSPDLVAVWIIQPDGFRCQVLDVSGTELAQMMEQLRQPFKDVKQQRITNIAQVNFDLKLSQRLYERIFLPIKTYLSGNLPVIIVPDGVLHYLPFEALVTNIEKKRHDPQVLFSRYENAHYLLEKLPISYAPSVSILGKQRTSEVRHAGVKGELLAFGRPYFGTFGQVASKEVGAVTYSEKLMLKMSPDLMFASLAETDVETVAEIMQPARIFLGHDATEEQFKKSATGFRHIYLSTHAVVDERQPMYSLVAFTQDEDPAEDGFLHAYEVFNLQLDADLVTLSACETGLGKLSRGEGIIGLTRAFLYAGAKSVLVSMWSVDESTSLLMKHFYQNLKNGQIVAQALRSAKLKLIKTRQKNMSFAHPFLWAPFVLVGQGKL